MKINIFVDYEIKSKNNYRYICIKYKAYKQLPASSLILTYTLVTTVAKYDILYVLIKMGH